MASLSRLSLPVRNGVTYGAVAWVSGLGMIVLLILIASGPYTSLLQSLPVVFGTIYWSMLHGWGALAGGGLSLLLLSAVPASLLFGVGYYAALRGRGSGRGWARRGALIVAGYAPMAALSYLWMLLRLVGVADAIGGGTATAGWNPLGLLLAFLVTGIVFPVAFGALGGRAAAWRNGE